jgi:hypothetical protein
MMRNRAGCSSIACLNFLAADRLPFVERFKMTTVTSIAQLNAAIVAADGVTAPGTVTITLGSDITYIATALQAINLHAGVTLVVEGGGHTLSGGGVQRGFFVYAGTVEIKDLLITDMLARGGDGGTSIIGGGGGAGAGLGGGLFVGANVAGNPGNVTLSNVNFSLNGAEGGLGTINALIASAAGGGGGLGGNGGAVDILMGGSGGGGIGADGGTAIQVEGGTGETGLVSGAAGGASGGQGELVDYTPGAGGLNGGGGGGGGGASGTLAWSLFGINPQGIGPGGGGGGGVGGAAGGPFTGGDGGFGGGGGGGGGDGGFGGGGGAGGGDGGFGGGGGGGSVTNGAAGFGGGGSAATGGYGGGGLGAGGAIFVQEGASLSFAGSTGILFNSVTGGGTANPPLVVQTGGPAIIADIPKGQAFGSGIYLQGNNTLTFRPDGTGTAHDAQGNLVAFLGQYIFDVIGDDVGSAAAAGYAGAAGYTMGQTGIVVDGTGTLTLFATNTYSGATIVSQGTLDVEGSIARSAVTVQSGGTLSGSGTTGAVTVQSGGMFDPGAGDMHTGSLSFSFGASLALQLGGTAAGHFDQVVVNGTVALGGATLDLSLLTGFTPAVGNSFRIIDNDGTVDAVNGTFAGHAEGSSFFAGAVRYAISYHGGDGNDVVLTVLTPNIPPVVTGAVTLAAIAEDSGARLITQAQLLGNATDADSPSLTATGLAIASGSGTLFDNHNGTWSYTPAPNDDTSVSFSYHVTDGATSVADSARLDITPVNDAPVVTGAVTLAAIAEDSSARLITQAQLLGNVTDDGPSLTATGLAISAGGGTLADNHDGTWSYTPAPDDDTSVSFSYSVTDGVAAPVADSATLNITPVNDAPVVAGTATLNAIAEDSGARLITQAELLGNVGDVDGPSLTAANLAIAVGSGLLVDNNNGTWSFTPTLNDDTSVSFSYQVTDGTTSVADSATLDITPVNDAPVVTGAVTLAAIAEDSGARLITQAELLGKVADVDGPALTATGLTITSGAGTLVDNNDGTWSYTPALNDDTSVSFSYQVTDGTTSVADSATLDITPVNDPPVNTLPGTFIAQGGIDHAITGLAVSDVDSAALTTVLHVDHGTLTIAAIGGAVVGGSGTGTVTLAGSVAQINAALSAANNVIYHGAPDFNGADHLSMASNDGGGGIGGNGVDTVAFDVSSHPGLFTEASDTVTLPEPGAYFALAGDDIIDMTVAGETAFGGIGNDTYHVEAAGNTIVELAGEGTDTVQTASLAAYALGANVENLTHTGNGDFTGIGNALDNVLIGGAGNDYLIGLGGNDVLIDGSGLNTLQGGAGNDIYAVQSNSDTVFEFANEGTDQVQTFLSFYHLSANVENLTFVGAATHTGIGNDLNNVLIGGAGNDYLIGLDGNDVLIDSGGLNTLQGGAGDDIYAVSSNDDTVFEFANEGTDEVQTFLAAYTLSANVEKLTFVGAFSHNGTGNELANTFTGSSASDIFTGAGGNDVFNYRVSGNGLDTITDFNADNANAAEHDHIDLHGRGLNFAALAITAGPDGVTIGIPGGDAVYLKNVAGHSIDAGDFFF